MEKWKENKKKYSIEYQKTHLKRVPLDMQLSDYEKLKRHTEVTSETVNGFIKRAISETMERDIITGLGSSEASSASSAPGFSEASSAPSE